MNASAIIDSIKTQAVEIFQAYTLSLHKGKISIAAIQFFNLPYCDKRQNYKTVVWKKPSPLIFKLNVDGASKGNPGEAGSGGIMRNHRGDLVFGFANYIGVA